VLLKRRPPPVGATRSIFGRAKTSSTDVPFPRRRYNTRERRRRRRNNNNNRRRWSARRPVTGRVSLRAVRDMAACDRRGTALGVPTSVIILVAATVVAFLLPSYNHRTVVSVRSRSGPLAGGVTGPLPPL